MNKAQSSYMPESKSRRESSPYRQTARKPVVNDDISLILPPIAHWSDRGLAAIIDALLFITPAAIGILLAAGISPISTTAARTTVFVSVLTSILILILSWGQEGSTGQTTGKRILGLVCINEHNGLPIGAGAGFKKGFFRTVLDMLPLGLGWFKQGTQESRRTFSDRKTNSVVVYSRMVEQQDLEDISEEDLSTLSQGKRRSYLPGDLGEDSQESFTSQRRTIPSRRAENQEPSYLGNANNADNDNYSPFGTDEDEPFGFNPERDENK